MKSSYNFSIDNERAVEQFAQSMIENSVEIFRVMHELLDSRSFLTYLSMRRTKID